MMSSPVATTNRSTETSPHTKREPQWSQRCRVMPFQRKSKSTSVACTHTHSRGKPDAAVERLEARIVAHKIVLGCLLHAQRSIFQRVRTALQPFDRRVAIAERGV